MHFSVWIQCMVLALEMRHKGSIVPSIRGPVMDQGWGWGVWVIFAGWGRRCEFLQCFWHCWLKGNPSCRNLCPLSLELLFQSRWKKKTEWNPRLLIHLENGHYNIGDGGRLVDFLMFKQEQLLDIHAGLVLCHLHLQSCHFMSLYLHHTMKT